MVADDHGNLSTDETIKKEQLSHVKFSTGFYYSEAETWDDMDGTQTWRVNHRESNFKRNFGATVNVPNIQDRPAGPASGRGGQHPHRGDIRAV